MSWSISPVFKCYWLAGGNQGTLCFILTIFSGNSLEPTPSPTIPPPHYSSSSLSRGNIEIVAVSPFSLFWSFSSLSSLSVPSFIFIFLFFVVVVIIYVIVMITLAQRPLHPEKVHNPANISSQSSPQISWQVNNETFLNIEWLRIPKTWQSSPLVKSLKC